MTEPPRGDMNLRERRRVRLLRGSHTYRHEASVEAPRSPVSSGRRRLSRSETACSGVEPTLSGRPGGAVSSFTVRDRGPASARRCCRLERGSEPMRHRPRPPIGSETIGMRAARSTSVAASTSSTRNPGTGRLRSEDCRSANRRPPPSIRLVVGRPRGPSRHD